MTIVNCPHCQQFIEIIELRCSIFRCGVYKTTYTQIHPHLSEVQCNNLVKKNKIYGCGKSFLINDMSIAEKCDNV